MSRCACCDLPAESCGRALEQRQQEDHRRYLAKAFALPGVIAAKYGSKCSGCGEWVNVGDPIERDDDQWIGVICCGRMA